MLPEHITEAILISTPNSPTWLFIEEKTLNDQIDIRTMKMLNETKNGWMDENKNKVFSEIFREPLIVIKEQLTHMNKLLKQRKILE